MCQLSNYPLWLIFDYTDFFTDSSSWDVTMLDGFVQPGATTEVNVVYTS